MDELSELNQSVLPTSPVFLSFTGLTEMDYGLHLSLAHEDELKQEWTALIQKYQRFSR